MARSSRRKLFFWRILIWLLLILAFGRASYLISVALIKNIFNEGTVIVPDLKGIELNKVKKMLASYKLNVVQIATKPHDFYNPGIIIEQDPLPGSRIKRGNRINVTVSSGKLTYLMPNIRNMLLIDAENTLRKYGFVPGKEHYTFSDTIPSDRIITTEPPPKEHVKSGSIVDILISKGKEKKKILVPDFSGMTENEVIATYPNFKFNIHNEKNENVKKSIIFRQIPIAGQPANSGSTIDIWVNKTVIPVKGNRHYEMISYIIPHDIGNERTLKIILTDERGVREVLNRKVMPGDKINYTVSGIGNIKLSFYLDDVLVKRMDF